MEKRIGSVAERVAALVAPTAQEMGLSIWDVEFRKEGSDWYLIIYLMKEGDLSIAECEAFSRAIDSILDEADPIEQSYYLEVSSAGLERALRKEAHFLASVGLEVSVKLYKSRDGEKQAEGFLESYDQGAVTIRRYDGAITCFEKGIWASVNIKGQF